MFKWNINWTRSCSDVVAFACVILSLLLKDNICAYDCSDSPLGAYDLEVATLRALVYAGVMTGEDARSCSILSTIGKGYMYKYGVQHSYKHIITQIMSPRMTTQSTGWAIAVPRGGRTGRRTHRGGGRTRGRFGDQGNYRIDGPGGQVGGQGSEVNDGVDVVPDFSTMIAQQLQNLLLTIST
nr:hypothetical protein [Tanacetum cinerariifolium]